jgi:hypothetical protein
MVDCYMKTRAELENTFYKENRLLVRMLEALSCANIQTSMVDIGSDQRLICSFDKTENSPFALLKTIAGFVKPQHVYQSNNHFSMSFSLSILKDKIEQCCRDLFFRVINRWSPYSQARCGLNYNNYGNELRLTKMSYDILRSQACGKEWYSLVDVGVGILDRDEMAFDGLSDTFRRNTIYYIGINDFDLLLKNTLLKDIEEKLKEFSEDHKIAMLMGSHNRLGNNTEIKHNLFENKKLFDRNLLKEIFSFFVPTKSSEVVFTHKTVNEDELFGNLSDDEKINQPILLEKIRQRSHQLKTEIDSNIPRANIDIKIKKRKFLELIQIVDDLNPTWSLKTCVEYAKQEDPLLFSAAMSGNLSKETKKLIDEIYALPQRKRDPRM